MRFPLLYCKLLLIVESVYSVIGPSKPIAEQPGLTKAFSITQVPIPVPRRNSTGGPVRRAVRASQRGSITGHWFPLQQNHAFFIQVGSPPQRKFVLFDTGAADTWLFSHGLRAGRLGLYDPRRSTTAVERKDLNFFISYPSGQWAAGDVYTDFVNISGVGSNTLIATVKVAAPELVDETNYDGHVGLAPNSRASGIRPVHGRSWFQNVKDSLQRPTFAAYMRHQAPSTFDFGFVDRAKYTGRIGWADTTDEKKGAWIVQGGPCYLGNPPTSQGSSYKYTLDSGAEGIFVPKTIADEYYRPLKAKGARKYATLLFFFFTQWAIPCDLEMPDLSVDIAGARRTVPGSYMKVESTGPFTFFLSNRQYCLGAVQNTPWSSPVEFALGLPFMKRHYVVFDVGRDGRPPRVGFAEQPEEYHSVSEGSGTDYSDAEEPAQHQQ